MFVKVTVIARVGCIALLVLMWVFIQELEQVIVCLVAIV
jgi:hypothetical protein